MSKQTANKLWLASTAAVSCICAALGALSMGYAFDFPIGQFQKHAPLWILTLIFGLIAVLSAFLYPIFALRKENNPSEFKISPFIDFASLFAASMLIIDAASTFLLNRGTGAILPQIKAGLAILASLFFIVLFARRGMKAPVMTGLVALTTLWATFEAFYAYFDPAFAMTSPFRTYPQLPCIALALLFLCETSLSAKPGKSLLLTIAAVLSGALGIAVGGATVIAYVFSLNREGIPVTDGLWMIALGIYGFARAERIISKK